THSAAAQISAAPSRHTRSGVAAAWAIDMRMDMPGNGEQGVHAHAAIRPPPSGADAKGRRHLPPHAALATMARQTCRGSPFMSEITVVAKGLRFPEGPVAMRDGSIVLVEIERQTITRVRPDGSTEVIAHTGGGPNGLAVGPDGAFYVCNNG